MKIISGSGNKDLAEKVVRELSLDLSPVEIFIFPDGERRIQIQESVLDQDVVIVQPASPPVDTNYFELFFLADAAKRSGARSVTAVVPYLGYQRQDHIFREGEAVSLDVVVKTMQSVGVQKILVFDLHTVKIAQEFSIPMKHLSALPIFAEYIESHNWAGLDTVLVSPDMGGIRRIKLISQMLSDMPFAVIEKNRDVNTGHIEMSKIEGEVTHRALIVDDMISSGKTIAKAAELLSQKGAEEIYVFATHAIFSDEAPKLLEESSVTKVFVSDTVFIPEDKKFSKLEVLSVAPLISKEL